MASTFRIKDDPDEVVLHASSSEESSDDGELMSDEKSSSYECELNSNSSSSDDSLPKAKKHRALIPPAESPPQPVSAQPPSSPPQDKKPGYLHHLLTLPSHHSFPSPQPLVPPSQPEPGVNYVAPSGDVWLSVAPPVESTPTANVLTQAQGPCNLDGASTVLDLWNLFLPIAILDMILVRTNEEGVRKRGNAWSQVVMPELYAAFGLLYYLGLSKSNHEKVRAFWRKGPFARPLCQAAMSGERFQDILTMMQFDDRATRYIRKRHDKFTAIREVTESFASSCRRYYSAGENVTVNEQLVPFRGRCSFKQYMPKKQAKHGLKFSLCVDSKSKYVCNVQPYIRKTDDETSQTQLGMHAVKDLVAHMYGTGRNVTTDSFFSSKELAEYLLTKKMTLVSTIKANHKEIPKKFRPNDDNSRAVKSSLFGFNGQLTLVSYVPKKHWTVLLLSTKQLSISLDPNTQKPEIIKYYNSTKAGVDTIEQMCNLYTVSRITKRWPMVVFYYIMNLAAINTYALWTELNRNWSTDLDKRGKFLADLSMALLDEQLQRRADNAFGLHRDSRVALGMLGYDVACKQQHQQQSGMQQGKLHGRCRICPRKGGKTTTKVCHDCKRFTCALHSNTATTVLCEDCACKVVDGVDN